MNLAQQLKWELKNQMQEAGFVFNVESVEEAEVELELAVEYIEMVYEEESVEGKVSAWVEDTKFNYPETFKKV